MDQAGNANDINESRLKVHQGIKSIIFIVSTDQSVKHLLNAPWLEITSRIGMDTALFQFLAQTLSL